MLKKLARDLRQLVKRSATPQPVWRGVYSSFSEVPVKGSRFANLQFLEGARASTLGLLRALRADGLASEAITVEFSLAPLVAAILNARSGEVCILDVGGGTGIGYVSLLGCLADQCNVRYHILELEHFAREGATMFESDPRVRFHHQLPAKAELGRPDLVLFASSLQYIEDYGNLLKEIFTYRPDFVYVLKIPVGDSLSFVTGQYNVTGTIIPVWILNQNELVEFFAEHGYQLIFRAMHDRVYDTTNFDPRFQFRKYSHLLFACGNAVTE